MPKRKPTALLEAKGAFKKDPSRRRGGEPVVTDPLGNCPESFSAEDREAWQTIVKRAPTGVLTAADWPAVVMAAKLFSEFLRNSEGMNAARITKLQVLLGKFGMTPVDRASISIPEKPKHNPWAAFD